MIEQKALKHSHNMPCFSACFLADGATGKAQRQNRWEQWRRDATGKAQRQNRWEQWCWDATGKAQHRDTTEGSDKGSHFQTFETVVS